jgi:hypothetical protein
VGDHVGIPGVVLFRSLIYGDVSLPSYKNILLADYTLAICLVSHFPMLNLALFAAMSNRLALHTTPNHNFCRAAATAAAPSSTATAAALLNTVLQFSIHRKAMTFHVIKHELRLKVDFRLRSVSNNIVSSIKETLLDNLELH